MIMLWTTYANLLRQATAVKRLHRASKVQSEAVTSDWPARLRYAAHNKRKYLPLREARFEVLPFFSQRLQPF